MTAHAPPACDGKCVALYQKLYVRRANNTLRRRSIDASGGWTRRLTACFGTACMSFCRSATRRIWRYEASELSAHGQFYVVRSV